MFSWGENDRRLIDAGLARQREILSAAGAEATWDVGTPLTCSAAAEADPGSSMVDSWCRTWDVANLYICDGSVFVTGSGVDPSLSIQAIARRTAGHLKRVARIGELRRAPRAADA